MMDHELCRKRFQDWMKQTNASGEWKNMAEDAVYTIWLFAYETGHEDRAFATSNSSNNGATF